MPVQKHPIQKSSHPSEKTVQPQQICCLWSDYKSLYTSSAMPNRLFPGRSSASRHLSQTKLWKHSQAHPMFVEPEGPFHQIMFYCTDTYMMMHHNTEVPRDDLRYNSCRSCRLNSGPTVVTPDQSDLSRRLLPPALN